MQSQSAGGSRGGGWAWLQDSRETSEAGSDDEDDEGVYDDESGGDEQQPPPGTAGKSPKRSWRGSDSEEEDDDDDGSDPGEAQGRGVQRPLLHGGYRAGNHLEDSHGEEASGEEDEEDAEDVRRARSGGWTASESVSRDVSDSEADQQDGAADRRVRADSADPEYDLGEARSEPEEEEEEDEEDEESDSEDEDFNVGSRRTRGQRTTRAKPEPGGIMKRRTLPIYSDDEDQEDSSQDELPKRKPQAAPASRRKPTKAKSSSRSRAAGGKGARPSSGYGPTRSTRTRDGIIVRKKYIDDDSDDFQEEDSEEEEAAPAPSRANRGGRAAAMEVEEEAEDEDDGEEDDEAERVLAHRSVEGADESAVTDPWKLREFYVKWKRYSHMHNCWDSYTTLAQLGGFKRVLAYIQKMEAVESAARHKSPEELEMDAITREMEQELLHEHVKVSRVVSERVHNGKTQYLVLWRGLPYKDCTWEDVTHRPFIEHETAQPAIDAFQRRESRAMVVGQTVGQARALWRTNKQPLRKQPAYLNRAGMLRDYQLEGVNWLLYSWGHNTNGVLADEMGLGKTVQCVSFLSYLVNSLKIQGPFLVVVPLSTVPNWAKEFEKWAPELNTITYIGDSESRAICRDCEFPPLTQRRACKFNVLLTTYELVLKDAAVLRRMKWVYTMVDEAHRLKNHDSQLYREMQTFHTANSLLVTGTPLQNSIKELWALLHFLEPEKFHDAEDFEQKHSLNTTEHISALHEEIRPHMLRRVIKDVEKSLPPKQERVLRVPMSPLQRQYYKWILKRNVGELNKGVKGSGHVSLLNVVVELKKCCNHPFLFESADRFSGGAGPGARGGSSTVLDNTVMSSGKMVLVDKLLRRLKETGHRVLIFSQMVRMLDIISDYCRMKGYQHQRLDGSIGAAARHQAMDHFNAPGSQDFLFLLSTRAGGLGINLASADTVIIFDSDWNPQNDLQAMSRAHRIGQKDTVNIYRFVTQNSVEEDILERAKRKMVLDHLVIQRMNTSGKMEVNKQPKNLFNKDELAAILRFGAEDLFKDEEKAEEEQGGSLAMTEQELDDILARAEKYETTDASANDGLLNSFKVANLATTGEDDSSFWSRLLGPAEEPEPEEELLPRAAKLNQPKSYAEEAFSGRGAKSEDGTEGRGKGNKKRKEGETRGRPRGGGGDDAEAAAVVGALKRITEWPGQVALRRREANHFAHSVKRFSTESARLRDVVAETGGAVEQAPEEAQRELYQMLLDGCQEVVTMHARMAPKPPPPQPQTEANGEPPAAPPTAHEVHKEALLDFFGAKVKAQEMLTRTHELTQLSQIIQSYEAPTRFRCDGALRQKPPSWAAEVGWDAVNDAMLLLGVHLYGFGSWDRVREDPELGLQDKLPGSSQVPGEDGKMPGGLPKLNQVESRAAMLLRKMMSPKAPKREQGHAGDGRGAGGTVAHKDGCNCIICKQRRSRVDRDSSAEPRPRPHRMPQKNCMSEPTQEEIVHDFSPIIKTLKKLRTLQKCSADMPKEKVIDKTRKYLTEVGRHVDTLVRRRTQSGSKESDRLRSRLWAYVAKFRPGLDGGRLEVIYSKLKTGPPSRGPGKPAGGEARAGTSAHHAGSGEGNGSASVHAGRQASGSGGEGVRPVGTAETQALAQAPLRMIPKKASSLSMQNRMNHANNAGSNRGGAAGHSAGGSIGGMNGEARPHQRGEGGMNGGHQRPHATSNPPLRMVKRMHSGGSMEPRDSHPTSPGRRGLDHIPKRPRV